MPTLQTFLFSKRALDERKKRIILMMYIIVPMILVFGYLISIKSNPKIDMGFFALLLLIITIFILLELYVVNRIMMKKMKQLHLIIYEEGFTRIGGKSKEEFLFKDIQKLLLKRDVKDEILLIKCFSAKKSITLAGFDDMEEILKILSIHVSDCKVKKYKIDWNGPMVMIIMAILSTLVMGALILAGSNFLQWFNIIIGCAFGVSLIVFKLISRSAGKRFRPIELFLGCVIIISNIVSLIALWQL